jgi:hypothetical protein
MKTRQRWLAEVVDKVLGTADVVDMIVRALSPAEMARASMSCSAFRLSVNRVVQQSAASLSRRDTFSTFSGATRAPSDGEGWASVARLAEQRRQFPLGGCEDSGYGGGGCDPIFPSPPTVASGGTLTRSCARAMRRSYTPTIA